LTLERLQATPGQLSGFSAVVRLIQGEPMFWAFIAFLVVLWLLGYGFHIAGNLIHVLLVVALALSLINLILGRRTV
jgi:hypothetical protein